MRQRLNMHLWKVVIVLCCTGLLMGACVSQNKEVPTLAVLPSMEPSQTDYKPLATEILKNNISPNPAATETPETNVSLIPTAQDITQSPPEEVSNGEIPATQEPSTAILISEQIAQPVPQQVVIQFEASSSQQEREAYVKSVGGEIVSSISALNTVVVSVPEKITLNDLPQSNMVVQNERDYYASALLDISTPTSDPYYDQQWALPVIGAPEAWLELPEDAEHVTVAVIDSGVCLDHPDLEGRILENGYDFVDDDDTAQDELGHGCGVAGIIAANVDNGIGIAGVAPNAMILPLRVLDAQGIGTYSDVAQAIVYATDNGAKIINLSLGGPNPSSTLNNAIDYAIANDVIVVAAAGNTGGDVLYPAAYGPVIAVGSVDLDLEMSSFSSRGPEIDVLAPGRDILTTTNDDGYASMSGTSFAAPYVTSASVMKKALNQTLLFRGEIVEIYVSKVSSTATPLIYSTVTNDPNIIESPSQVISTIPISEGIKKAIFSGISSELMSSVTQDIYVLSIDYYDEWAIGTVLLNSNSLVNGTAMEDSLIAVLYHGGNDNWRLAYQGTTEYAEMIRMIPHTKISEAGKDALLKFSSSQLTNLGIPVSGLLKFPWAAPQKWQLSTKPHGSSKDDSIDLIPINSTPDSWNAVASASGIIIKRCEGKDQAWLMIRHPSGGIDDYWTGYLHLDVDMTTSLKTGESIDQGDFVGRLFNGGGTDICGIVSYGAHLHFTVGEVTADSNHINLTADTIPISGTILSGWTIGSDCLTKDDVEVCEKDGNLESDNISLHGQVGGVVVDENNQPIQDATVRALSGGLSGITNSDGIYVLNNVPAGGTVIEAVHSQAGTGSITMNVVANISQQASDIKLVGICVAGLEEVTAEVCDSDPTTTPDPDPTQPPSTGGDYTIDNISYPSSVSPRQTFVPQMRVCVNNGQLRESAGDMFRNTDGNLYGAFPHIAIVGTVSSGQCQDLNFYYPITAPNSNGTYNSHWQLWVNGNYVSGAEVNIQFTVGSSGGGGSEIILHDDPGYNGEQRTYGIGEHDIGGDSWNDRSHSLTVPSGMSVRLYEHGNFEGQNMCFSANTSSLPGPYAEGVSSLKVYGNTSCQDDPGPDPGLDICGGVVLHDSGGGRLELTQSVSNLAELGWNDRARMIEVVGPYRATAYDGENLQGWDHGPFTGGTFASIGTNVTSVRVEKIGDCPDPNGNVPSYCFESNPGVFLVDDGGNELRLTSSNTNLATIGWNDRPRQMYVVGPYRGTAYDGDAINGWNGWKHGPLVHGQSQGVGTNVSSVRVENISSEVCVEPPKPDLIPFNLSGASVPVVASLVTGDQIQDVLLTGQPAYFDFGYRNRGDGNSGAFDVKLFIDNQEIYEHNVSSLNSGQSSEVSDWALTNWTTPGCFTVRLSVDANSEVNEDNEGNNIWTRQMCWEDPTVTLLEVAVLEDSGQATTLSSGSQVVSQGDATFVAQAVNLNAGDSVQLRLTVLNNFLIPQSATTKWVVLDPLGREVPGLGYTESTVIDSGGWWIWITPTIPANSLTGDYTFIGSVMFNGKTTADSDTFYVDGLEYEIEPPIVSLISPSGDDFIKTNQLNIIVNASDAGSGVDKVQFYVGYDESITPTALDLSALSWDWHEIGLDTDGSDGWSFNWDATGIGDQVVAVWAFAYDRIGNYDHAVVWNVTLDRTSPTSIIDPLPVQSLDYVQLYWSGTDNVTAFDNLVFDIQYQVSCVGDWIDGLTLTDAISWQFMGTYGESYCFRSRAHDLAGNVEEWHLSPNTQTTLIFTPMPTNENLIRNGDFDEGKNSWVEWGDINWNVADSQARLTYVTAEDPIGPATIHQDIGYFVPANSQFEITLEIANNASVEKPILVALRDKESWTNPIQCSFILEPNVPLRIYTIRGITDRDWTDARIEMQLGGTPDDLPEVIVDTIIVQYNPELDVSQTECNRILDQPEPMSNLVRNHDFSLDKLYWHKWGDLVWDVFDNRLNFHRVDGPEGVAALYQDTFYSASTGSIFEISVNLSNPSDVEQVVKVALRDSSVDWEDKYFDCDFSIPPQTPQILYIVRGLANDYWINIRTELQVEPPSDIANIVVDDISVQYKPDLSITQTECLDTAPETPELVSPANNPTPSTINMPTFSWQSVAEAVRYELQLDTVNPPILTVQNSSRTSYKPFADLLPTTYFWRVRAINETGFSSNWSETRSLLIISSDNAAPSQNYVITSTPTLSWNRVTGATEYEIEVAMSPSFADPLSFSETVPANTLYVATTALNNGMYYWRVRAKNGNSFGSWSVVQSIVVNAQ